jgi:hypothetical protein
MLHKSHGGSDEKGIAMATGIDMMQLCANLLISGVLYTLGWPRQSAVRCRRQALFLHFLPAVLMYLCNRSLKFPGRNEVLK